MASKKEKTRQRIQAQKRKKRAARICGYLIAAILINFFFYSGLMSHRKATTDNTITCTVTIESKHFKRVLIRRWYWGRYRYIATESGMYRFSSGALYTTDELDEMLLAGDTLTISYIRGSRLVDKIPNKIVDATFGTTVLSTAESFNEGWQEHVIMDCVLYFLVTGVYSFVMVCCEGWFMQWIRAGSKQRKSEAEQRHKANIAANKAAKAKKE